MNPLKIVIVSNNTLWCEIFENRVREYETMELTCIISNYTELYQLPTSLLPEIIIADLDLLISSKNKYELLYKQITNWNPKFPFIMAIGDGDHRAINKGEMRYGVDFWNNKTPEDRSVEDVLLILKEVAPLLLEAKSKWQNRYKKQ